MRVRYDSTVQSLFTVTLALIGTAAVAAPEREDAVALLKRVVDAQLTVQTAQRELSFRERTTTRKLRKDGTVSRTESKTFVVTPGPEGEYRQLVAKNGHPLDARETAKEQRKLDKQIEHALRLTAAERERKAAERIERRVKRYRSRLEEAMEIFEFEAMPDEEIDAQRLRVFMFRPKPSYKAHSRWTKILARMEGTVWIDAARNQLAKLDLTFRDDLNFLGGLFGKVSKGTRATARGCLREKLWLLENVDVSLDARLYFLKGYRQRILIDFDEYETFSVDTAEEFAASRSGTGGVVR